MRVEPRRRIQFCLEITPGQHHRIEIKVIPVQKSPDRSIALRLHALELPAHFGKDILISVQGFGEKSGVIIAQSQLVNLAPRNSVIPNFVVPLIIEIDAPSFASAAG